MALATGWTFEYIEAMSAHRLREWMIYDRLFPFGDERADMRVGVKMQRPKTPQQIENELRHRLRGSVDK